MHMPSLPAFDGAVIALNKDDEFVGAVADAAAAAGAAVGVGAGVVAINVVDAAAVDVDNSNAASVPAAKSDADMLRAAGALATLAAKCAWWCWWRC